MFETLQAELANAFDEYARATANPSSSNDPHGDYRRISEITRQIIAALKEENIEAIKLNIYAFSRQASDSFCTQPAEFKRLSDTIHKMRKQLKAFAELS